MKITLEQPAAVLEAREKRRGLVWPLEVLVFLAVFIVATLGELVVMVPGELAYFFQDEGYRSAALAQDMAAAETAVMRLARTDMITVIALFSNIMIILVVFLFVKLIQKRRISTLGFCKKGMLSEYARGVGIGFVLFTAAVVICVLTGSVRIGGVSPDFSLGMFLLFTAGFMIQGMAEEVLCRGYFLISLGRRYPMTAAVLISSLAFASMHLLNEGITPLAFLNLTLFGIFASVIYIRRGNIWMAGAIHTVWNLAQGNIYGIRVSGMNIRCTLFSFGTVEQRGLIHGGTFGMEGGLAVTVVLIAAICIAYRSKTVVRERTQPVEASTGVTQSA